MNKKKQEAKWKKHSSRKQESEREGKRLKEKRQKRKKRKRQKVKEREWHERASESEEALDLPIVGSIVVILLIALAIILTVYFCNRPASGRANNSSAVNSGISNSTTDTPHNSKKSGTEPRIDLKPTAIQELGLSQLPSGVEDGIPLDKLSANLQKLASNSKRKPVILLSTGALCPIHVGHVRNFELAKAELEKNHDVCVVAGYLSASHDNYVKPKLSGAKNWIPANHRCRMVELACLKSDWISSSTWETSQGSFKDYPEVSRRHLEILKKKYAPIMEERFGSTNLELLFLCGSDHAKKCGLQDGMDGGIGVCIIEREGYELGWPDAKKESQAQRCSVYSINCKMGNVSSTMVRQELKTNGYSVHLNPSVMDYIQTNGIIDEYLLPQSNE